MYEAAALGALIYSAGLLFTALMVTETGIFLGQMLIGIGMGNAGISIALVPLPAPFHQKNAPRLYGQFYSFGQFALLPITQLLIGGYGWQMALALLSVLTGAMMAVALGMRGDKPGSASDVAAVTTGEALQLAVRSRDYLLLTTGFFVCGMQLVFITTHLPVYLEGSCDLRQHRQLVAGAGRAVQHSGGFHLWMAGWQIVKTQNTGKRLSASRSGNCRLCDHATKRDKRAHASGRRWAFCGSGQFRSPAG